MSENYPPQTSPRRSQPSDEHFFDIRSTGGIRRSGGQFERGIESRRPGMYDRPFSRYVDLINYSIDEDGFDIGEWKGKTMLDLGSGAHAAFAEGAGELGVKVFSVNPALKSELHRDLLRSSSETSEPKDVTLGDIIKRSLRRKAKDTPSHVERSVAAVAQKLPFKSDTFDCVVSVFGVPQYLHDITDLDEGNISEDVLQDRRVHDKAIVRLGFNEIVRVLAPGGKAYLTDMHSVHGDKYPDPYSRNDGSAVAEVLAELTGVEYVLAEKKVIEEDGKEFVVRTIQIAKLTG